MIGEQMRILRILSFCGRLEYMIHAAACGWDTELEHIYSGYKPKEKG